jgi:excisionase family DNA binding protein
MIEIQELKDLLQTAIDKTSVTPRWLSIKQACNYASMSRNTLMAYIESGEIYGTLKGGKYFVDRDSMNAFFLDEGSRSKE